MFRLLHQSSEAYTAGISGYPWWLCIIRRPYRYIWCSQGWERIPAENPLITWTPNFIINKVARPTHSWRKELKHMTPLCVSWDRSSVITICQFSVLNSIKSLKMIPGRANMKNCKRAILRSVMGFRLLQVLIPAFLSFASDWRKVKREQMGSMFGKMCSWIVKKRISSLGQYECLFTHLNCWVDCQGGFGAWIVTARTPKKKS